jgi:hypothetical protein
VFLFFTQRLAEVKHKTLSEISKHKIKHKSKKKAPEENPQKPVISWWR